MDLHPDCEPLAFLLGTWKGQGQGSYPTIESFPYLEEVSFAHVGKPFLSYSQKTRHGDSGLPLHAETGYLRATGGMGVELVIAQPSGIVELHSGIIVGSTIELRLDGVHTTPTAKSVTDVRRLIRSEPAEGGQRLVYDVEMAAVGEPMTHHLHAELMHQPEA